MIDLKIRQYQSSDLTACRSLWQELTEHHGEIYDDPSLGGEESRLLFDKHLAHVGLERVWVAEIASEVVGLVSLIVDGVEGEIEPVIVKAPYRNRAVGRILLYHAVEEAKKLEIQYLSVKPVARNERAVTFFRRHGFDKLGHIQMFMDLNPEASCEWKPGADLLGNTFQY